MADPSVRQRSRRRPSNRNDASQAADARVADDKVADAKTADVQAASSSSTAVGSAPVSTDISTIVPPEGATKPTARRRTRGTKRRNFWIFVLGGIFGVLVAAFFADHQKMIELPALAGLNLNLEALIDVLPAGLMLDFQNVVNQQKETIEHDPFTVGIEARERGIKAHHPVVMIPGVISTGLESWGTSEISLPYFRKRLWGSWTMMRALVLDQAGWKRHIMLDKETGLDPPDIKLRAAQGFDATDFFITGYWIWSKIIENLAAIGYDPTTSHTAAYDWRLAYPNLEKRDQYFSRLKRHIEMAHQLSGKKAVLLSHSMGSQVLYYFLHWVEAMGDGFGNGGPKWVETHVDSWINISGCLLGAIKDVPAVISGEMRDTVQLNALAMYGLEKFLSRAERAEIFRAMPGLASMLPIGGNTIWGDADGAPDDPEGANFSYGAFINFRDWNETATKSILPFSSLWDSKNSSQDGGTGGPVSTLATGMETVAERNLTVDDAMPYLYDKLSVAAPWYRDRVESAYSRGIAKTKQEVEANQLIPKKWVNPLETRLPLAPNLKIYCFYGIGKATERAYWYKPDLVDPLSLTNVSIDSGFTDPDRGIDHGVVMGEGDGTVSLISTGYMCAKGWTDPKLRRFNPAGVKVKTIEMPHEPERFSTRGGPKTADHVDILGRRSLNEMILKVVGGRGDEVEEDIVSRVREYADKVKMPEG